MRTVADATAGSRAKSPQALRRFASMAGVPAPQFPHARRHLESRRQAVTMAPTRCILTLTQAENPASDQPAARHWRRTAERAGPLLLIVLLVALAISALMIRFPLVERLIVPIFVGLQSVPKIAIAPLILVWVGAGTGSKVAVVVSIAFFPIVINTMAGFKEVDRGLADVFRSVDANERQMFFRLRLPYAMPYIFAGLRIATTLAVLGAIVAEWLAASNGLGYLVLSGSFNFNTARSFAAIIALAVIGTTFFAFMSWVERMISL